MYEIIFLCGQESCGPYLWWFFTKPPTIWIVQMLNMPSLTKTSKITHQARPR